MPDVCFYFQVHQPRRLRRYSVFETEPTYFDDHANSTILRRVAQKCYLPATDLLLRQIERHGDRFVVAFSLTGQVIEQFKRWSPEVLDRFRQLSETGCVEFLSETYDHSLASQYSAEDFEHQVRRHDELIDDLFGQKPSVFRNTELIYANSLAKTLIKFGRFRGVLAEGVDGLLGERSPNHVYKSPGKSAMPILLKNHRLSDDLAFRFSDPGWPHYPLKAGTYAQWLADASGDVVNLFIDFETFGEHQWEQTGIFGFLDSLPDAVLASGSRFLTPSQAIERYDPVDTYDVKQVTSWADSERDISAWQGNAMQSAALNDLYAIEPAIKATHDPDLIHDWQALSTSDHFYYMCTKYYADADVHAYFNPYESPYDAYINFMNVLDNLKGRLDALGHASA
ncbi:MAG: glycoside hydrolase family 57 protein [Planctomycetota bacterium]